MVNSSVVGLGLAASLIVGSLIARNALADDSEESNGTLSFKITDFNEVVLDETRSTLSDGSEVVDVAIGGIVKFTNDTDETITPDVDIKIVEIGSFGTVVLVESQKVFFDPILPGETKEQVVFSRITVAPPSNVTFSVNAESIGTKTKNFRVN